MGYQWAILAVFVTFALLEAKNGKLFKKATEVSDDGKVELIGTLLLFTVTQPLVLFCSAAIMGLAFPQLMCHCLFLVSNNEMPLKKWQRTFQHSAPV